MSQSNRKKTQKRAHKPTGFGRESNQILSTVQVDNRIFKRRLPIVTTITSDAVSRIKDVFTMNPSTAPDWASLATMYDEFRVVGCRLRLVSRTQNTVTLASNAVIIVYDNDDSGVLTTYAEASEYQNCHMIPALFNNAHTYSFRFARPSAGKETALPWIDVGAPASSLGSVKFYADTLSASTNYFACMFEWAVEFRGIR